MFTSLLMEGDQLATSSHDRVILKRLDTWVVDEVLVAGVADMMHLTG